MPAPTNGEMLSPPSGQRKAVGTNGMPVEFDGVTLSPMPIQGTLLALLVPLTPQFEQALNGALGLEFAGGAFESRQVSKLPYIDVISNCGRMATAQFGPQHVHAAGVLLPTPPTSG